MPQIKQEVLDRKHQYELSKPLGMTALAPRKGYYLVLNTSVMKIAGVDCRIARGLWKPTDSDEYYLDHPVTIQIKSLEGINSIGPKHKLNKTILKSIIHVMKAEVITKDGKRIFQVEWDIFNNPSSFLKGSLDDDDEALQMINSIESSDQDDHELLLAINQQVSQDDEVMQAILVMEDNALDELEMTNEWLFALQAQDLPTSTNHSTSNL